VTPCEFKHRWPIGRRAFQKPPAKYRVEVPFGGRPVLVCGVHVRQYRTWSRRDTRYRIEQIVEK
jgi:hypothetical protein